MRVKKNKYNTFFHPFEIAICSDSKKHASELTSKIIKNLCSEFDIGHLMLNKASSNTEDLNQADIVSKMIDSDFLFIEDQILSKYPKIIVISNDQNRKETMKDIKENKFSDILAIVSEDDLLNSKYPFFKPHQIKEISNFILKYFKSKIPQKINGLILTGGKSKRMNEDKGAIKYHNNLSQIAQVKGLINGFCNEVYISCREEQQHLNFLQGENLLFDSFPSVGPTSGILSAQFKDPTSSWLVLACDLPYLDKETINDLINKRNPYKNATCYLNSEKLWPEPLCTIYEPKSFISIMKYFAQGKTCPRKVLFNSNIQSLKLRQDNALNNVNTPIDKQNAIQDIQSNGELYAN